MWCMFAKWRKGELDLETLNRLTKGKRIEALLDKTELFSERTAAMAAELRKAVGGGVIQ